MGLVLARRHGERTVIDVDGHRIVITMNIEKNGKVKLAFFADPTVKINREEIIACENPQWEEALLASINRQASESGSEA